MILLALAVPACAGSSPDEEEDTRAASTDEALVISGPPVKVGDCTMVAQYWTKLQKGHVTVTCVPGAGGLGAQVCVQHYENDGYGWQGLDGCQFSGLYKASAPGLTEVTSDAVPRKKGVWYRTIVLAAGTDDSGHWVLPEAYSYAWRDK
jgi:hypothetical protein